MFASVNQLSECIEVGVELLQGLVRGMRGHVSVCAVFCVGLSICVDSRNR